MVGIHPQRRITKSFVLRTVVDVSSRFDIWDIAPGIFQWRRPEASVADFLRRVEGFTLLMSTYQSVEVIEKPCDSRRWRVPV